MKSKLKWRKQMTPKRAAEIRDLTFVKGPFAGQKVLGIGRIRDHITAEEDNFVTRVWETMSGFACWADALKQIAREG